MIAALLKIVPLESLLKAGYTMLLSNQPMLHDRLLEWIHSAQLRIQDPGTKWAFVKKKALELMGNSIASGFLLDTGLQMLVAWWKLKNPDVKFEGPLTPQ